MNLDGGGVLIWCRDMAFKISGNLGDKKPFFQMAGAVPGTAHVEVMIDDKSIDREHASRVLRMMAERLLECNWPPDQACESPMPSRSRLWDDHGTQAVPSGMMILDVGPVTVMRIAAVLG
jgi:3-phosphoglycerate kinase